MVAEAVAAMSQPRCSNGKKGTDTVSKTPTASKKTPCAAGVQNRRVCAITGEDGKDLL